MESTIKTNASKPGAAVKFNETLPSLPSFLPAPHPKCSLFNTQAQRAFYAVTLPLHPLSSEIKSSIITV